MNVTFEDKQVGIRSAATAGAGKPHVVFIHGAGGSGRHWLGQYRALRHQANLHLVDLPGHGRSEGPSLADVEDNADWLARFLSAYLSAEARDNLVLAGHSMGGAIAQAFVLAGGRARGLVLVCTGAKLGVMPSILEMLREEPAENRVDALRRLYYAAELSEDEFRRVNEELQSTPAELFLGDLEACGRWDARGRLGEIQAPTLILAGERDQAAPAKWARYLADEIPLAKLSFIAGAGHMPMLEAAETVNELLSTFLLTFDANP